MEVNLVVIEGKPLGAVIPIKAKRFVIGRESGCQLRPKSPTISNRHCAIIRHEDHVIVQDLGSSNGTLVNDRCLHAGEAVRVSDGDRLQVGQLIFTIQVVSEPREDLPSLEEWLMSSDEESSQDEKARTLIIGALNPASSGLVERGNGERGTTPNLKAPVRFAFRRFDPVHRVASIGLSQDQLNGDQEIRALRKALSGLAKNPRCRRLVLDLDAVDALPSAACALLLALANRWQKAGGKLRLSSLNPEVERMIEALKLDRRIEVFEDCPLAITEPWD